MNNQRSIVIEEIARSESAWQRNVRFGSKSVETPGQIIHIEKDSDIRPITDRRDLESLPQGLTTSIATVKLLPPAQQSALPGFELAEHEYEALRGNVPVFFDPDTNVFYNGRETDRDRYRERGDMPGELRQAALRLGTDTYNTWWVRASNENRLLKLLMWSTRVQIASAADAILPFAPHIDGAALSIADIAIAINAQTRTLVREMAPGRESVYYNLAPNAFRKTAITDKILDAFGDDINAGTMPALVMLKITPPSGNDAVINYRIRTFFERLNELKSVATMSGKPFAVGLIAPTGRGAAMVFGGVDMFVETFGPPTGFARARKGVPPPRHGRYYHPGPGFYDFISFEEAREIYEMSNRTLPCACIACERYAQVGLPVDNDEAWNSFRRVHFVNARQREREMFLGAIQQGTARDAMDWVGRGNNAHYGAWLPQPYV